MRMLVPLPASLVNSIFFAYFLTVTKNNASANRKICAGIVFSERETGFGPANVSLEG
jgi:hypothetical protein